MKKLGPCPWLIVIVFVFSGCEINSGVAPMGNDTFMVSHQAATGFHGMVGLKVKALRVADDYCKSQGKCLKVIHTVDARPPYIWGNFPKTEVQFMCLEPDDPRLTGKESGTTKPSAPSTTDNADSEIKGFGTGFFISSDGLFITAAHVVKDASAVNIYWQSKEYSAEAVLMDETLDVAVLMIAGIQAPQALLISSSSQAKTGDSVFTLGFPHVQLQGIEPKYTDGSISSLSGIANDAKDFQISVPVQPGNSGGPLIDSSGNVVGLITARLDEIATLKATGSLPQNVNYALKSSFILPLLESLPEIQLEKPSKMNKAEAIEKAKNAVGLVVCYGSE